MPEHLSDAALLHAIKDGDAAAFKLLYDRYWQPIYLKACQRVDKDTAKDMVQEVMTTLWRRRNEIYTIEEGGIGRYLYTAIRYRVISHYAYTANEIEHTDVFDVLSDQTGWDPLETKELAEFIEEEVGRLPSKMQQVFRMSREEDNTISDIASRLNISEQTVKNQLTEALKRLRESLGSRDNSGRAFMLLLLFYFCIN